MPVISIQSEEWDRLEAENTRLREALEQLRFAASEAVRRHVEIALQDTTESDSD